ncbi:MAG: HAMP domain-containing histidine kinase [Rhodobacteraceae bacterium]|nr:HAMP domain-containing histidine kinase [Paracoccaceae bacterium]
MSAPRSLRGRLIRRMMVGASLSGLVGVVIAAFVIAHEMGDLMDDTLAGSARLALALYQGSGNVGAIDLGETAAIRITDAGGAVISAPWAPLSHDGGYDVEGWRVFRLSDPQGRIVVEVGQSNAGRNDELFESTTWLLGLMLPVLLVALIAVSRAVASGLRPATRFADTLGRRDARDLSPVAQSDLPSELTTIPLALNRYLASIRTHVDAERQFATNAAHELRTPIAAASGQAQLIAAGLADDGAANRLAGALQRLGRLVERLLQLSRAEAGMIGTGQCDLVQVTRMLIVETGLPVVFDDGDMARMPVATDPDALALILRNLMQNAADHGTGDLRVSLAPGPVLTVSNAVARGAAFRHATFDKSASSHGAGLGLAIVARVAEAQRIDLTFAIEAGRATVTLRFAPQPCSDPAFVETAETL